MSPDRIARATVRQVPVLATGDTIGDAVLKLVEAQMPALPIVEEDGKPHGIFGEREFITALFPGYLGELKSAAFMSGQIDDVIERRLECRNEPVSNYANTEHVWARAEHSDVELAEIFLHHRVLIIPVVDDERVTGVVTRWEFFKALVESFTERD